MIDDYQKAMSLVEKMKKYLSVPIYATSGTLKFMEEKGEKFELNHPFLIEDVMYSGEEGGIMCKLKSETDEKIALFASLTHLRVGDDHPLVEEIRNYQKLRTLRLALADGKKVKKAPSSKKKKGFGV